MYSSFDAEQFKAIFRAHPAGVAIITLDDDTQPMGFTATSVISVSASPPVIVFSVQGSSSSLTALQRAQSVIIHFLDQRHQPLAQRFATPGIDRFSGIDWSRLPTDEPLLSGIATWVRCTLIERTVAGSSLLVQASPAHGAAGEERSPIIYHDRGFCGLAALVSP